MVCNTDNGHPGLCARHRSPAGARRSRPRARLVLAVDGPVLTSFAFEREHPQAAGQHRGIDDRLADGHAVVGAASGHGRLRGDRPGRRQDALDRDARRLLRHARPPRLVLGAGAAQRSPRARTVGRSARAAVAELSVPYVHLGIRRRRIRRTATLDPLSFLPAPVPPAPVGPARARSRHRRRAAAPWSARTTRCVRRPPGGRAPSARPARQPAPPGRPAPARSRLQRPPSRRSDRRSHGGDSRPRETRPAARRSRRGLAERRRRPPPPTREAPSDAAHATPRCVGSSGARSPPPHAPARGRSRRPGHAGALASPGSDAVARRPGRAGRVALRPRRCVARSAPEQGGKAARIIDSDALLPDDADLLRERDAAHRARVHDDRRGHRSSGTTASAATRRSSSPAPTSTPRRSTASRRSRASTPKDVRRPRSSSAWRELPRRVDADYDFFIRTTDEGHKRFVQEFLQRIYDNGDIYQDVYVGLYCVGLRGVQDASPSWSTGMCPEHGTVPEHIEEKNWFFRLSAYQDRAARALRRAPRLRAAALPLQRGAELHRGRSPGLQRSAAPAQPWGVPIPWDPEQVTYVWVDALINYLSALTYARAGEDLRDALLAGGPAPARQGHPALPLRLLAGDAARRRLRRAAAAVRARLPAARRPQDLEVARQRDRPARPRSTSTASTRCGSGRCASVSFGQDGQRLGRRRCTSATSASSRNDLGNLVSRTTAMIARYRDGRVSPGRRERGARGRPRRPAVEARRALRRLRPHGRARGRSGRSFARSTGTSRRPRRGSSPRTRRGPTSSTAVLYDLADGVRVVAVALVAVPAGDGAAHPRRPPPAASTSRWTSVAYGKTGATDGIEPAQPLFPRVDAARPPRRDRHPRAPRRVRRAAGRARRARARGRRRADRHRSAPDRVVPRRRSRSPSAHDGVFAALGIHPHQAGEADARRLDELRELLAHPSVPSRSARPGSTTTATTRRATRSARSSSAQLELAAELGKPVVIHTRERPTTTRSRRSTASPAPSSSTASPCPALLLGRRSSAATTSPSPGTSRYPKAARAPRGRGAQVPADRLLAETDSPYLAPAAAAWPAERAGERRPHARRARGGARRGRRRARAQIDANATRAFGLP